MEYKYPVIERHLEEMKEEYGEEFKDYISEYEEVLRKAKAYNEVSKAYQYYMPNEETQHSVALACELNRILIRNFVPPTDFSVEGFTLRNYNDDIEESEQDGV